MPVPRRAPLRRAPTGPGTAPLSALAIDFGTSTSTATLFDNSQGDLRALLPAQAGELFAALADLLRASDWPAAHLGGADFPAEVADRVRERLARGSFPSDREDLAARLAQHAGTERDRARTRQPQDDDGDRQDRAALLDATCLALEQLLYEHGGELSSWLAPRLHAAYEQAFRKPSLASHYLTPLYLAEDSLSVPSLLVIRERGGAVEGRLRRGEPQETDLGAFPGIKRYLNHPERAAQLERAPVPPGWQPDTDLLIGLAYTDLADLIERAAPEADGPDRLTMRKATITYPTTTPPGARRRLGELVREGLSVEPDISYDEGTAAALFFVMSELGEPPPAASRPCGPRRAPVAAPIPGCARCWSSTSGAARPTSRSSRSASTRSAPRPHRRPVRRSSRAGTTSCSRASSVPAGTPSSAATCSP